MSHLPFDPLLLAIATPLAVALAIALGLPKRLSVKLAYVGFGVPALLALHCWYHFPAHAGADYAFTSDYATGLSGLGISLKLGLNGISMPLFARHGASFRHPPEAVQAEVRGMPEVKSLQITFHEGKLPEDHAMPPGGFRLAVINATSLAAARAARRRLAEAWPPELVLSQD